MDRAIQHLKERAQRALSPPQDAGYEERLNDFVCVLAIVDMDGPLRRYGHRTYKEDPKKLEAFNKKFAEFVTATGTAQERQEFINQLYRLPPPKIEKPADDGMTALHRLYHRINAKKFTELQALGLEVLYKPTKNWAECPGGDCSLRTDTEKSIPRGQGR